MGGCLQRRSPYRDFREQTKLRRFRAPLAAAPICQIPGAALAPAGQTPSRHTLDEHKQHFFTRIHKSHSHPGQQNQPSQHPASSSLSRSLLSPCRRYKLYKCTVMKARLIFLMAIRSDFCEPAPRIETLPGALAIVFCAPGLRRQRNTPVSEKNLPRDVQRISFRPQSGRSQRLQRDAADISRRKAFTDRATAKAQLTS